MEFRPPSYFALAALIDGPLHGYGIVQRAAELSEGRVKLSTGTLYALLDRAIAESLVTPGDPYIQNGRQRRDYELTAAGLLALTEESEQMARDAKTITARVHAKTKPAGA
jgi:DNA-binding PadR family transcriptional regulator